MTIKALVSASEKTANVWGAKRNIVNTIAIVDIISLLAKCVSGNWSSSLIYTDFIINLNLFA